MRGPIVLVVSLLAGCGGMTGNEWMDPFLSAADRMDAGAQEHERRVAAAQDLSAVTALIDVHAEEMGRLRDDMTGAMGQMEDCGMDGAGAAALGDARARMDRMSLDSGDYRNAHERHTSLEECRAAAADHARRVGEQVAGIRAHRQHMMEGMSCSGMDGMHL